mmetsp:Transcript_14164/g.34083  ORF Transcript_14164/g.34083 Transcript_14164/m.34083 type:complete len:236 (+) Transcript_14164:181-888(+)
MGPMSHHSCAVRSPSFQNSTHLDSSSMPRRMGVVVMTELLRNSVAIFSAMAGRRTASSVFCSHMPCAVIHPWYSLKNVSCRSTHVRLNTTWPRELMLSMMSWLNSMLLNTGPLSPSLAALNALGNRLLISRSLMASTSWTSLVNFCGLALAMGDRLRHHVSTDVRSEMHRLNTKIFSWYFSFSMSVTSALDTAVVTATNTCASLTMASADPTPPSAYTDTFSVPLRRAHTRLEFS